MVLSAFANGLQQHWLVGKVIESKIKYVEMDLHLLHRKEEHTWYCLKFCQLLLALYTLHLPSMNAADV
jgi:hypothetical protein